MILIGEMVPRELRILAEQESQAAVEADKRLTMLVCAIEYITNFIAAISITSGDVTLSNSRFNCLLY